MAGDAGGSPRHRERHHHAHAPPPVSFGAAFALVAAVAAVAVGAFGLTSEVTLGIDLGTTYSVAATCEKGTVRVVRADPTPADASSPIPASHSRASLVPSVVHFPRRVPPSPRPDPAPPPLDRDDDALVGEAAARLRDAAPERTVYDAKRIIGRAFDDPDVADETAHLTFAVVPGPGQPRKRASPFPPSSRAIPRTSSHRRISARASSRTSNAPPRLPPITQTTPRFRVRFAHRLRPRRFRRRATRGDDSRGDRAGFRVARLLEEPVAAAIAYGVHEKALNGSMSSADGDRDGGRIVVVYDLGGGALDVAVLRWETSARAFLVMATAGGPEARRGRLRPSARGLAQRSIGDRGDRCVGRGDPGRRPGVAGDGASSDGTRETNTRARRESVRVRVVASREGGVARRIDVEPFEDEDDSTEGSDTYVSTVTLTRAALEASCASLLEKSTAPVASALRRAGGVTVEEVDDVVMVGGSSRLVAVRERVREMFGDKVVTRAVDPDTAIAVGAAKSYAC